MKIFKIKYLIASLVVHSALVSIFLLSKDLSKKPETNILVTEIIEIEEIVKSDDIKKKDYIANKKKNENLKKLKEKNIPILTMLEPEKTRSKSKHSKSEEKTKAIKHSQKKDKMQKNLGSFNIKPYTNLTNKNKEISKAIYKIGSINNPHPPYPIIARKKGLQGKLILGVSVNNDGSVKNVSIKKSSGHHILDKVSKETIEKWTFVPAKKLGLAVEDNIQVPIRFVLTD